MIVLRYMQISTADAAKTASAALLWIALAGCSGGSILGHQPEPPPPASEETPPPPAPTPPPIDLAGRWHLTSAGGGTCYMTLAADPGAAQGKVAPEGGCPGSFFTSRKWIYQNGLLIIQDFKDGTLAQLSHTADHFEGQDTSNGAITLAR